jgi:hypothetical protein
MTVYLFNVKGRGRRHRELYSHASDGGLVPFFDLERSGAQERMVPLIEDDAECIVASYVPGRREVVFSAFKFGRFDERPTNMEPNGQRFRVFLGTPDGHPIGPMTKATAAGIPRFKEFFNCLGNFKGVSAFQK